MKQFNPKTLQQFRKLLYPAIAQGIITGYNVYNESKDPNDTALHYLHSNLGISENGKSDKHLETLVHTLHNNFPTMKTVDVINSITTRYAVYKHGNWFDDPNSIKLYDTLGNQLTKTDILIHEGIVIVEGYQFDLQIKPTTKKQRRDLMRLLYKYTHLNKWNREHKVSHQDNPHSIIDSWEIPLIVCLEDAGLMKETQEVKIRIGKCESRIITSDGRPLIDFLKNRGQSVTTEKIHVNKSFYMSYLSDSTS